MANTVHLNAQSWSQQANEGFSAVLGFLHENPVEPSNIVNANSSSLVTSVMTSSLSTQQPTGSSTSHCVEALSNQPLPPFITILPAASSLAGALPFSSYAKACKSELESVSYAVPGKAFMAPIASMANVQLNNRGSVSEGDQHPPSYVEAMHAKLSSMMTTISGGCDPMCSALPTGVVIPQLNNLEFLQNELFPTTAAALTTRQQATELMGLKDPAVDPWHFIAIGSSPSERFTASSHVQPVDRLMHISDVGTSCELPKLTSVFQQPTSTKFQQPVTVSSYEPFGRKDGSSVGPPDGLQVITSRLMRSHVDDLTLEHTPKGTGAGYGVGSLEAFQSLFCSDMSMLPDGPESAPLSATLMADWCAVTGGMDASDLEAVLQAELQDMGSPRITLNDLNGLT
jgi:hypothetical protein